jgi:hypothetical protein
LATESTEEHGKIKYQKQLQERTACAKFSDAQRPYSRFQGFILALISVFFRGFRG